MNASLRKKHAELKARLDQAIKATESALSKVKMKECSKCAKLKPESEYYQVKSKEGIQRLYSNCKDCHREHQAQYYKENKEYHKTYQKLRYLEKKQEMQKVEQKNARISLKPVERRQKANEASL